MPQVPGLHTNHSGWLPQVPRLWETTNPSQRRTTSETAAESWINLAPGSSSNRKSPIRPEPEHIIPKGKPANWLAPQEMAPSKTLFEGRVDSGPTLENKAIVASSILPGSNPPQNS